MVPNQIAPTLIAHENIPLLLPLISADLAEVIEKHGHGLTTYNEVVEDLRVAKKQLWVLVPDTEIEAWIITSIAPSAFGRRLIIDFLSGHDLDALAELSPTIYDWAIKLGATELVAYVRPGLRKKLKKYGFHHAYDVVTRPLIGRLN